jgi:hypothetical protein
LSVFRVDPRIGVAPPGSLPFVLPQGHARRRAWSRIGFSPATPQSQPGSGRGSHL